MDKMKACNIFVTVGSTKFHALVKAILSEPVLNAISKAAKEARQGEPHVIVQFGATAIEEILFDEQDGLLNTKGQSAGTLPIKILGEQQSTSKKVTQETGNELAPTTIKEQLCRGSADADHGRLGLKHFSMDWSSQYGSVHLEMIDYVPSIKDYLEKARIVVSHAGSGTILEALRLEEAVRPKLVVVPNETLMDNHQTELAKALSERHYVYAARLRPQSGDVTSMVGKLPDLLYSVLGDTESPKTLDKLQGFPAFVPGRFRALVDEEMGYIDTWCLATS